MTHHLTHHPREPELDHAFRLYHRSRLRDRITFGVWHDLHTERDEREREEFLAEMRRYPTRGPV